MPAKKRKQFCDLNPVCYQIALKKEILRRHLRDAFSHEPFAREKSSEPLPFVYYRFRTNMIKRAPGVDLTTQFNKAKNIDIASSRINGLLIHPGETFSFWRTVGRITKRRGYTAGRVIVRNKLTSGIGGGLCNLGHCLNRMILHSPLTVTEFHKHSDSLAPDEGMRIPLSSGTSVAYNNLDYRFRNTTDYDFQILLWCEGEELCGELRGAYEPLLRYELVEEGRHFRKEGDTYYNVSKIYRLASDIKTNELVAKDLIWDNHSEVMYDYDLIPKELIREATPI